jgi:hypothetical protein
VVEVGRLGGGYGVGGVRNGVGGGIRGRSNGGVYVWGGGEGGTLERDGKQKTGAWGQGLGDRGLGAGAQFANVDVTVRTSH